MDHVRHLRSGEGRAKYVLLVSLLVAVVGSLLLAAVSLIPRDWIQENAEASAIQLSNEGEYPTHHSPAGGTGYIKDNFTDALIIQTSYTLSAAKPSSILLNYIVAGSQRLQGECLMNVVNGLEVESAAYSRYWMGFRVAVKPLLCLTSFRGICVLIAAVFTLLMALAVATTARRNSTGAAVALAAALCMVEPYAVVSSIQYASCFLLMLCFTVYLNLRDVTIGDRETFIAFCFFGALTQFFDFYTYPLICFGIPLLILIDRERPAGLWRGCGALLLAWLGSWLAVWLLKLCFVTVFTGDNGFADAASSVRIRLGIGVSRGEAYSPVRALASVVAMVRERPIDIAVPVMAVAAALSALRALLLKRASRRLPVYLAVACLPAVWFMVAAQPTIIHTWFQYRSVCVFYLALLLIVVDGLRSAGMGRIYKKT